MKEFYIMFCWTFYADIMRLSEFHHIDEVKTDKIVTYTTFWILKRKPIQLLQFSDKEKDIFVNERFACCFLINECLSDTSFGKIDGKIDNFNRKYYEEYIDLLLYYFKYRTLNPQVLELVIETFKIGRLFPVIK